MIIKTSKHNSPIRHYLFSVTVTVFFLVALGSPSNAQSTDPANPTLITTKQVEGKAKGLGATYYYRLIAKGGVKITLRGQTNNYATQFEADLISSSGADLGKIYVSASDTPKQTSKVFDFDNDQQVDIVVKLSKDDSLKWQYYRLTFDDVLASVANDGQPDPASAAPDLVVSEIIFDQSPSQIRVRVMNNGSAASSSCYLALLSGAGDDPSLGKKRVWSIQVPALEPGKGFSTAIDLSPLTQSNGPWKATIDRSNSVKESNETNNSLTHPL